MTNHIFKKTCIICIALYLCVSLCACSLTETTIEELMQPPRLSESRKQIQNAIAQSLGTSYTLTSAQNGTNRSSITLADLNGDEQNEAICLYTTNNSSLVHIMVLQSTEGSWIKIGQYDSDATTVDKLEFSDIDDDGLDEIVVGWGYMTGSDHVMEILKIDTVMSSLHKQLYNQFVVAGKSPDRIVVINTASASAVLLGFKAGRIALLSSVPMDSRAQSILSLSVSKTASGSDAVYVDTQLDNQMYATEVLVINSDDYLENKLFTGEHMLGDRPGAIKCTDINGDGIPEIPQAVAMNEAYPNAYYTYWYAFDGSKLSKPTVTFTSSAEQFYFEYPDNWKGKITILKDEQNERLYHFFINKTKKTLYSLQVFTPSEYDEIQSDETWNSVIESTDKVLAWQAGDVTPGQYALSVDDWQSVLNIY